MARKQDGSGEKQDTGTSAGPTEGRSAAEPERTRLQRGGEWRRHSPPAAGDERLVELQVRAFGYPCAGGSGRFNPGYRRFPRLDIILTAVTGESFTACEPTDDDGLARLAVPANQTYRISARPPRGYELPDPLPEVEVGSSGVATGEIGFVPTPGILNLSAFLDRGHGAERQTPQPISVDIYQGHRYIACITTGGKPYPQAIDCPGLVTVAPRVAIIGARRVRPVSAEIVVQVGAGETVDLRIPIEDAPGQLRVAAFFVDEADDRERHTELPATFDLYEGHSPVGDLRQSHAAFGTVSEVLFDELREGYYTIVAHGPETVAGVPIEPFSPRGGVLTVHLPAGQASTNVHEFLFRPCLGRVSGLVVDGTCSEGLEGVEVVLYATQGTGQSRSTYTGSGGTFFFPELPPGEYVVGPAERKVTIAGARWEWASTTAAQRVTVTASRTTETKQFSLVPEEAGIYGVVRTAEGELARNAVVEIYYENGELYRTVVANEKAEFRSVVPRSGRYLVGVRESTDRLPVVVSSYAEANPIARDGGRAAASRIGPGGGPPGGLGGAVEDIASYPLIITEEVGVSGGARPAAAGAPGAAPLGQIVHGALREVLAWRPKPNDPKGFVAALTQAFTCKEFEGRTQCAWTPRSYAVQADIGAVTGAQASIHARARAALAESVPLLEGLFPLRADSDNEETEAARAIVRSELTELVNELGVEGGPRVERVDALFQLLLGLIPGQLPPSDPLTVGGQLGRLREAFGLKRLGVNTVDEERNLTNFMILVEYVSSLKTSWESQREFFARAGAQPFLGTQLVLLSRALGVVAESVQEVQLVMDSVFLRSAERQTVSLTFAGKTVTVPGKTPTPVVFQFPSHTAPLFVSELLAWAERFASEEGPRLIQDGGRAGVNAFFPTIDDLRRLVRGALIPTQDQPPANPLPAAYRTVRVQRALQELAVGLDEVARLADPLKLQP
jgi:Carboxypeptidase regulatory-like domain